MGRAAKYSPGARGQSGRVCLLFNAGPSPVVFLVLGLSSVLPSHLSSDTDLTHLQLGLTLTGPLASLFLSKVSNQTCESCGSCRPGDMGEGRAAGPGEVRGGEGGGALENLGLGLRPGAKSGEGQWVRPCLQPSLVFRNWD